MGFIDFEKYTGDYSVHSMKKTVEQRTVMKEKIPKVFINRKNNSW